MVASTTPATPPSPPPSAPNAAPAARLPPVSQASMRPVSAPTPASLSLHELGALSRYERPLPELSSYDLLLGSGSEPTRS